MTIRVIIFLYLVNSVSAQTWDVSDYYGVATIKAPVELPYSGGPIPHASWKVTGPLGEVAWQQFSNGNVGISQPARSASKLSLSYNGAGNLVRISSECTPSGAYYAKSYTQTTLTAGEIVVPRHIGEGAVSSNVTDGTNYYVVASGAGFCGAGSAFDQSFLVSTTPGGSAITVTDRGSGGSNSFAYDWTIQGAVWDGSTGLRIHSTFVNGDPVRFQCAENGSGTCTLPTGLSAGTTYYLKTNGTDLFLVYSDHALSSAVNVTGAGSGINEVISYWVYTLTNSASAGIAVTNPVVISSGTTYTDITNGLTGFRIANPCNANWGSIQGINTPNGWVAARAPNLLYTATGTTFPQTTPVSSLSCTLNWIERGPLKTEVQVTYTSGGNGLDGQPGVYIADIVLYADSRSVIPRIETNLNISEYLNVSTAFDTMRWRPVGTQTYVDTASAFTSGTYYRLQSWSPFTGAGANTQPMKYGQVYQASGASGTNLIGVWGGFGEEQIQGGFGAPGFYVSWASPLDSSAGTWINLGMYAVNGLGLGQGCTRTRRRIGIYSSTKADLPASTSTMSEMALFNFQFSLAPSISKLLSAQYAPASDPPGGWPYPFMTSAQATALITLMRTNLTSYNSLAATLTSGNTDPYGKDDIVGWRANDATGSRAMNWAGREFLLATVYDMYTRFGNYAVGRGYYELIYNPMLSLGGQIAELQDSHTSAYLHSTAQRFLGFYCGWVWDPAYAPLDDPNTGESFGLPDQYNQAFIERQIFSTYCTNQPYVKSRYLGAESVTRQIGVPNWMDAFGDHTGIIRDSPQYIGASAELFKSAYSAIFSRGGPALSAYESGLFTGQTQEEFAQITPCDIRFGPSCHRTTVSYGDSGYRLCDRCGSAAKFSSNQGMKYAWDNFAGDYAISFFNDALFANDYGGAVSPVEQTLGPILLPNLAAAPRFNYGTVNETYAFHILGPANDHMHTNDDGGFSLWALNSPVSLIPNNLYAPVVWDRALSNSITMATERNWLSAIGQGNFSNGYAVGDLTDRFSGNTAPTTVNYFAGSTVQWSEGQQVRTGGPIWNRRIRMFNFDPAHPVIVVSDSFAGSNSTANKIFHYQQFSTSPVTNAPGGTYTPAINDWTVNPSASPTTFKAFGGNGVAWGAVSPGPPSPATGAAVNLTTNALNRFSFVGDGGHIYNTSGTINWDFYVLPSGSSPQFSIGSWCGPIQGQDGYFGPLEGSNPKECQELVKVNSAGATQEASWLPYLRSGTANGVPTSQSCGTQVILAGKTTCWDTPHVQWTDGTNNTLATFDATSETFGGLTISGGTAECDWNATTGTLYVSGTTAGTRTVTLPAGFSITSGATGRSGSNYTFYHPGGVSPPTYSFAIATTPVSRRTSKFAFSPPAGTATVRIKAGSAYAVSVACSSACSASVELPSASQSVSWEFVDGAGSVLFTSNPVTI